MSFPLPTFTKTRASRVVRPPASFTVSRGTLTPAGVLSLAPAAWFRYGQGITVTGSGVSQWDDASGNARHLLQGTDTNRPALQADGSILFDGVDNFLKCSAFTLNQPMTLYLLGKMVAWAVSTYWCDGNSTASMGIQMATGSPGFRLVAGASTAVTNDLAVSVNGVISAVFNGASSVLQVNNGAPITGNAGASNAGGFMLGANAIPGGYANVQIKEAIIFPVAHDSATRKRIVDYLVRSAGIN